MLSVHEKWDNAAVGGTNSQEITIHSSTTASVDCSRSIEAAMLRRTEKFVSHCRTMMTHTRAAGSAVPREYLPRLMSFSFQRTFIVSDSETGIRQSRVCHMRNETRDTKVKLNLIVSITLCSVLCGEREDIRYSCYVWDNFQATMSWWWRCFHLNSYSHSC